MPSLATKLGLQPGQTVRLIHAPDAAVEMLRAIAPEGIDITSLQPDDSPADLLFLWPKTLDGMAEYFMSLQHRITPDGAVWVIMPKKAYAARHGIDFTWEQMQTAALSSDLVDNKVAALNDEEYATRFVIRRERRTRQPSSRPQLDQ